MPCATSSHELSGDGVNDDGIMNAELPALKIVREQLTEAIAAKKCHSCGCLHKTVEALAATDEGRNGLAHTLDGARRVFIAKKYDCLGCDVCFPAIAANAFAEVNPSAAENMDLCPTEAPDERAGWPPLPGDFYVVRYRAPVAVCTLNDAGLAKTLAARAPEGLAIAGSLHTENLGIERIIKNVIANPHIRYLILCGEDTQQAVGHLPGQSLQQLCEAGVDERGRIVGALGKRPVLKNVTADEIGSFRRQVKLISLVGEKRDDVIAELVESMDRSIAPVDDTTTAASVAAIRAAEPERLTQDPAGFFVVYPDRERRLLVVEHYTNQGVLANVLEGETPTALYSEIIKRSLISRLDHAAYLGRELARAHACIDTGERYVQDRAPGEIEAADVTPATESCACKTSCGDKS